MDIKQRIQELSLDDKAKLYFMGLVRKGEIDTLPENPKAAYIKMVMDKADPSTMHDDPGDIRIDHDYYAEEKTEDYKPSHRAYNVIDKSNNDKIVAKELSRDKALELAKTNKDYMIDATDRLAETRPDWTPPPMGMGGEDEEQDEYDKGWYGESSDYADRLANSGTDSDGRNTWGDKTGYSDEEMAQGKGKLKKYPDKDGRNVWGDKVDYSDVEKKAKGLKELAEELGYLNEVDGMEGGMDPNAMQYQKVRFVYSEQGGRFYGLDVYVSKDQPQRSAKLRYDEANEWLKDTLHYIHEDDLIPRQYGSGLEDLDLIVDRLRELDIEASHNEYDFS